MPLGLPGEAWPRLARATTAKQPRTKTSVKFFILIFCFEAENKQTKTWVIFRLETNTIANRIPK